MLTVFQVFVVVYLSTIGRVGIAAEGLGQGTHLARPNIVVFFMDDLGYADVRPFGQPAYATPNIDRLAREGRSFTDFAVSSAVCSASRAALLTGCYHSRIGIHGALGPNSKIGISDREVTLAESCRSAGYATACIGKWHLGDHEKFLPLQHGFDEFFGLPYSNDMWPLHPEIVNLPENATNRKSGYPPLRQFDGNRVVDEEITADDQMHLTTDYTRRAIDFIRQKRDQPFFLYLAHSMVHVPLFASSESLGKSNRGLFGDVMLEIDWSLGQVLETLDQLGLSGNTLVIFCSDNGPWLSYGNHAGSAMPLREGKGTSFEGGVRVPTIMRWPEKIPANSRCDEFAATIDIFPTIAKMVGAELPQHPIDGLEISALLFQDSPPLSPHGSYFIYYANNELQAVRDRQWKLVLPHSYRTLDGKLAGVDGVPAQYETRKIELSLFDLKSDCQERTNLANEYPEIVARLHAEAAKARLTLGDSLANAVGSEVREPGRVD